MASSESRIAGRIETQESGLAVVKFAVIHEGGARGSVVGVTDRDGATDVFGIARYESRRSISLVEVRGEFRASGHFRSLGATAFGDEVVVSLEPPLATDQERQDAALVFAEKFWPLCDMASATEDMVASAQTIPGIPDDEAFQIQVRTVLDLQSQASAVSAIYKEMLDKAVYGAVGRSPS